MINLVASAYIDDPRVEIINADIFEYQPAEHYDCAWFDIWDDIPPLIKDKPYQGYSDPKHRLPSNPIQGFKRQNKWNRTRSNPKLR